MSYLVCSIYDRRPDVCKKYPQRGNYIPDSCGYYFVNSERRGDCYLECQAACCMLPRENGEPGGAPLPEIAGGMPCKYLEAVDEPPEGSVVEKPED
jgi:hypothetical protein